METTFLDIFTNLGLPLGLTVILALVSWRLVKYILNSHSKDRDAWIKALQDHAAGMNQLSAGMNQMTLGMERLVGAMDKLEERIERIEDRVEKRFDEMEGRMNELAKRAG